MEEEKLEEERLEREGGWIGGKIRMGRRKGKGAHMRLRWRKNKYRGGTSDATASSSLIVPLFMTSFDDL